MWCNSYRLCLLFVLAVHATRVSECRARTSIKTQVDMEVPTFTTKAPDPSISHVPACDAQCVLHLPRISALSWVPEEQVVYTTNLTVGAVSTIIYMDPTSGTAAVNTHVVNQWSGDPNNLYPPWPNTDDDDNSIAVIARTDAGTTTMIHVAYPQTFIDYHVRYSWEGTLLTSNEAGAMACAVATAGPWTDYLWDGHPLYPQPTPTERNGSASSTKRYVPLWVPPPSTLDEAFFRTAFPSAEAMKSCTPLITASPTPTIFSVPRFFWDHTTVTVWDNPSANCSHQPASTGGVLYSDGTREALYPNTTTPKCAGPTILTVRIDDRGTTRLYGDGPHQQTGIDPPITRTGDRSHAGSSGTSWEKIEPSTTEVRLGSFMRSNRPWTNTPCAVPTWTRTDVKYRKVTIEGCEYYVEEIQKQEASTDDRHAPQFRRPAWTDATSTSRESRMYIATTEAASLARASGGVAPPQQSMPVWDSPIEDHEWHAVLDSDQPDSQTKVLFSPTRIPAEKTPSSRALDATEAALVAGFFSQMTQDRVRPASLPQRTQSSARAGPQQRPIDPNIIANRVDEKPQSPTRLVSGNGLRIALLRDTTVAFTGGDVLHLAANVQPSTIATLIPKPFFTSIPTIIDGISTTVAAYIIPQASTVSVAQEVTLNGRPTTLSIPDLLPTYMATTINGVPTSTLAYVVTGNSIATVGQTISLDGKPTILPVPDAVFAQIPTTANGVAVATPAYIIRGSLTASIGQSVTLDGTPTVLTAPDMVPTLVATTSGGVVGSRLVYVLSTSSTATVGETVTLGGGETVLSRPTGAMVVEGRAAGVQDVSWNAAFVGLGVVFVVLL